jgi:hypothetical protein
MTVMSKNGQALTVGNCEPAPRSRLAGSLLETLPNGVEGSSFRLRQSAQNRWRRGAESARGGPMDCDRRNVSFATAKWHAIGP